MVSRLTGGALLLVALLLACWFPGVLHAQVEPTQLSISQAIEKALSEANAVKLAELDVDRARHVADHTWNLHGRQLQLTYNPVDQLYTTLPTGDAFPLVMSADRRWHIAQKAYQITKDATELSVKKAYFDVLQALDDLTAAQKAMEYSTHSYQVSTAMFQVGMVNHLTLGMASSGLEKSRSELRSSEAAVDEAYRGLNRLIGFDPLSRPILVDHVPFEKLLVDSPGIEASRAKDSAVNPALWIKQEQYEIARYMRSNTSPELAGKVDVDKAYLEYNSARETAGDQMYNRIQQIMALEASYAASVQQLRVAEDRYRIEELRHRLGMSTKKDLLETQLALSQVKAASTKITAMHCLTKELFEKPWLAQQ